MEMPMLNMKKPAETCDDLDNDDLTRLYDQAETVDSALFAEQRSNLLLISGDHYQKKKSDAFNSRLRDAKNVGDDVKLRLTKNHIKRISRLYLNNILTNSPNVTIVPQLDQEMQDQKNAELNLAVWKDAYSKYKLKSKIRDFAQDFIDIGECVVKCFWDPNKGNFKGFKQQQDDNGQDMVDETGQPVPDNEQPVFSGAFVFERIFGFNLLRAPEAKDMDDSPYLIIRKMVNTKELKKLYAADEDKLKFITSSQDETYLIFDGNRSEYNKSNKETLILEHYYRPCMQYPKGYFYIKTKSGILEEGELPFGLFPIIYKGFEKLQTSPRCHSQIRQLRPYQIEINRCASAIATHQVTLGDDKVITNTAGKIEQGGVLPGVRVIKVPGGGNIDILPGRSGDQYLGYMQSQIEEMYVIANINEEAMDKELNGDPFNLLFASIKQKKKFSLYIEKFEEFLCEMVELFLDLAKHYLPDDEVIPAIGKREAVNLPEFRNTNKLCYSIKVEPQTSDPSTLFGKQMIMNHTLQYVGGQMDKDDIGKIIRNMPFANMEESFDDLTIDYDNARNDMLALERGEQVQANPNDNHVYMSKKLVNRMKKRDFNTLPPQVQQGYQALLQQHDQIEAQQQQQIQAAEAGFIPTGGYLVKADFYIPDPKTGENKRATLPYEAIQWLVKKLDQQGLAQDSLQRMQQSALSGIATEINHNQHGQAQAQQMQGAPTQGAM
jgi:hypothetical protein